MNYKLESIPDEEARGINVPYLDLSQFHFNKPLEPRTEVTIHELYSKLLEVSPLYILSQSLVGRPTKVFLFRDTAYEVVLTNRWHPNHSLPGGVVYELEHVEVYQLGCTHLYMTSEKVRDHIHRYTCPDCGLTYTQDSSG